MSRKSNRFRKIHINVPVTPQERQMIADRAARCHIKSVSEYLRIMGIDGCILVVDDSESIDQVCYEIHKIGVNINQLAHWANANQTISEKEIIKLKEYIEKLWQLQNCILSSTLPLQR